MTSKPAKFLTISENTITLRHPPYTYFQLSLNRVQPYGKGPKDAVVLDELTVRWYLDSALQQYLGLTGAAIPVDILKVENQCMWIRVPFEDGNAVAAAVSQWYRPSDGVSLRIVASGTWLGGMIGQATEMQTLWTL